MYGSIKSQRLEINFKIYNLIYLPALYVPLASSLTTSHSCVLNFGCSVLLCSENFWYIKFLFCSAKFCSGNLLLSGTLFLFYMILKIDVYQKFANPFLVVYIYRQLYCLLHLRRFLWIRWRSPWNFLCNLIFNKINFCFCCHFYNSRWFWPRGFAHFSPLDKHP